MKTNKILYIIIFSIIIQIEKVNAQLSSSQNYLIGYWHNWGDSQNPYLPLNMIDTRYNIIEISFAVPTSPSDMNMTFVPDVVSQSSFISQVQQLKAQGKKVLISIGGANAYIDLTTSANQTAFVNSMTVILNTFGFDGIDIDIEHGNSVLAMGGSIAAPTNPPVVNLINGIKQIMTNYRLANNKKMLLTMAPETAFVHGGKSAFGGVWGGYLPIINALRDSLDILQVQLYNSGSMMANDNNVYTQASPDFIVGLTEALIMGFSTPAPGGMFVGLPAHKIAIGLPSCSLAAPANGYMVPSQVKAAMDYLRGVGPKPGQYTLSNSSGYPSLRKMMTWSINWDQNPNCASSYEYANNFQTIFNVTTNVAQKEFSLKSFYCYPNPSSENLTINVNDYELKDAQYNILNCLGQCVLTGTISNMEMKIDVSYLKSGLYSISIKNQVLKFVKQ